MTDLAALAVGLCLKWRTVAKDWSLLWGKGSAEVQRASSTVNLLSHIWCNVYHLPASSLRVWWANTCWLYSHMKQSLSCRLKWLFLFFLLSLLFCFIRWKLSIWVPLRTVYWYFGLFWALQINTSSAHRWARHYSIISWTDSEWKLGARCGSTLWGKKIALCLLVE